MAAYQFSKRLLATLLLLTLCATWLPAHASIVPLRLPQETVPWSSPREDAAYTLTIKGAGLTPQTFSFADPATRPICFTWEPIAGSSLYVRTVARSYATGGGVLMRAPGGVLNTAPTTIEFQTLGKNFAMPWRAFTIIPKAWKPVCLVTNGSAINDEWINPALAVTSNPLIEAMFETAQKYFAINRIMADLWSRTAGVYYEHRPSMAMLFLEDGKIKLDVLQETLAFMGTPLINVATTGGETMPYYEQLARWKAFRLSMALQAGISEAQAIHLVTQRGATSGVYALLEAAANGVPIVSMTQSTGLRIRPYDAATGQMILAAMAGGARVIATVDPVTSGTWKGTPWLALGAQSGGTFLNTMRGGQGTAAGNPDGTSHAAEMSHAKSITALGKSLSDLGFATVGYATLAGLGPVATAIGLGVAAIGIAVTLEGYRIQAEINGKRGHVDIDEATPTAVAAGPGPGDASGGGGPAGSAPGGPGDDPSEPGVGTGTGPTGFSGGGGDGDSPGDIGEL